MTESFATSQRGDLGYRDFHKQIVEKWHALPENKRAVYNEAYKSELEGYKRDLAKWELKMIRLGNQDLVRQEALIEQSLDVTRKPKSRKTKTDWSDGWCSDSSDDAKSTEINSLSSIQEIKNSSPPKLPQADEGNFQIKPDDLKQEVNLKLSSSDLAPDTTGDQSKPLPSKPEQVPSSTAVNPQASNSKESVIHKLKDFFKF